MATSKRVLFISQEIFPYLEEETPIRMLNRRLPQHCQEAGIETRTFMPKFGEINERRNQLHEVIRLSGQNIIINQTDHPLLLKVASIQSARIQIYFIDNDDYFHRRKGLCDDNGIEFADNEERAIFFARGTLDTIQKLRWTPNVVMTSGWMAALAPIYIRKAFNDTPFFADAKIIVCINDQEFQKPFSTTFANKVLLPGVHMADIADLENREVTYIDLMKMAIDYADAVCVQNDGANPELIAYAKEKGLPVFHASSEEARNAVNFIREVMSEE